MKYDRAEPVQGDYVLDSGVYYDRYNARAAVTVWINKTPLPTFYGSKRRNVITPLLKKGHNEIRVESRRIKNVLRGEVGFEFKLRGPARHSVASGKLEYRPIMLFLGETGWKKDPKTLQPVGRLDLEQNTIVRTIGLYLRHDPARLSPAPADGTMAVRFDRYYDYDNGLNSTVFVNGTKVGEFSAETFEPIEKLIKPGWNDVRIKTKARLPVDRLDWLTVSFGPHTFGKNGDAKIESPLWLITTHLDWKLDADRLLHKSSPKATEAELSYRLFYSPDDPTQTKLKAGDFRLQVSSDFNHTPPVVATMSINGKPLSSFLTAKREVIITPLLKSGRNEFKIATERIDNSFSTDGMRVKIYGPAKYNPAKGKHLLPDKPLLDIDVTAGWKRNPQTGLLTNVQNPRARSAEQVHSLIIK